MSKGFYLSLQDFHELFKSMLDFLDSNTRTESTPENSHMKLRALSLVKESRKKTQPTSTQFFYAVVTPQAFLFTLGSRGYHKD